LQKKRKGMKRKTVLCGERCLGEERRRKMEIEIK
jgi:hypothetical protein